LKCIKKSKRSKGWKKTLQFDELRSKKIQAGYSTPHSLNKEDRVTDARNAIKGREEPYKPLCCRTRRSNTLKNRKESSTDLGGKKEEAEDMALGNAS